MKTNYLFGINSPAGADVTQLRFTNRPGQEGEESMNHFDFDSTKSKLTVTSFPTLMVPSIMTGGSIL